MRAPVANQRHASEAALILSTYVATPPPTRDELIELYRMALEEYRFQVNLNWNRTHYYLALNVGLIGIATGIMELAEGSVSFLTAGLYFAGVVCCLLSLAAARVQQGYYQAARDHKTAMENQLGLGSLSVTTTPGMGSTIRRLGKVTTFNNIVLGVLALMNTLGVLAVTAAQA